MLRTVIALGAFFLFPDTTFAQVLPSPEKQEKIHEEILYLCEHRTDEGFDRMDRLYELIEITRTWMDQANGDSLLQAGVPLQTWVLPSEEPMFAIPSSYTGTPCTYASGTTGDYSCAVAAGMNCKLHIYFRAGARAGHGWIYTLTCEGEGNPISTFNTSANAWSIKYYTATSLDTPPGGVYRPDEVSSVVEGGLEFSSENWTLVSREIEEIISGLPSMTGEHLRRQTDRLMQLCDIAREWKLMALTNDPQYDYIIIEVESPQFEVGDGCIVDSGTFGIYNCPSESGLCRLKVRFYAGPRSGRRYRYGKVCDGIAITSQASTIPPILLVKYNTIDILM